YYNILPDYGNMTDFKSFVEEAHRRNIRVITELVVNHTSDQHPLFQRARRAPPGSSWRNYYAWSKTPDKYADARIIFTDTEHSNWAWDHLAQAYYWHRFYSHQPDLNYDNPAVKRMMLRVMDYWLKLGVDGMRVDAVPYLYEREGTSCENLPESHAFVKQMRAHIDKKFQSRMLLAEANQWPEDAASYFGSGDEFHMAFHFPLMPRMFMAIQMEDRFPIIDILQQTPPIPQNNQWAVFLRNHDELTLEMVTDEERDYMYRVYASEPAARLNLGIRRRLAPLLNNDRRKIELMNILLFSLPGTPVIYYGDEIGMGDNFYLGDRNGVRTPMQWSPDRNAGFSHANPQRLYLPPIIDPEYHYEAINVDTQQNNSDSLLWWMKHTIALRKRYCAFGHGSIEFLHPKNRKVLAFLRRYKDDKLEENILVIANLSHLPQQTELDLSAFPGCRPVDLFGRVEFAPISDGNYYFTLSPHAYFWFSLEPKPAESLRIRSLPAEQVQEIPTIAETEEALFRKDNWFSLENPILEYLRGRRWFRGKARHPWKVEIRDVIPMALAETMSYCVLAEVKYAEGEPETYVLPLTVAQLEHAQPLIAQYPGAAVARLQPRYGIGERLLYDAMADKSFGKTLLTAIGRRRHFDGTYGKITTSNTRAFRNNPGANNPELEAVLLKVEQTNSSLVYGNSFILKLYRKLEEGLSPDVEIGRFLTERTSFAYGARVAGTLDYNQGKSPPMSLAILHDYVPNEGDAWQYTLDSLERYFKSVLAHPTVQVPPLPPQHLLSLPRDPPDLARETIGAYLNSAQLLGQRTAEMHIALASGVDDPEFAPEPYTYMYQNSRYQSMRGYTARILQMLRRELGNIPEDLKADARRVLELEPKIMAHFQLLRHEKINAARIRIHGDYHLGQVLYTGKDFVIIDFDGEPARSLSERRLKRSPLRDIAGMVRSFHYAVHSGLLRQAPVVTKPETELPILQQWARYWYTWVSAVFLTAYLETVEPVHLLPDDTEQLKINLDAFLLDKAVYEIGYELDNRPDWLRVPLQGILQLMETSG
ncbi:MAG: maltose alpha-D-glucosyltransferase, partial [Dehalococcoidales bacterium]|nr:maltose alpha-D-glucosyltransferase [Dehalococcoidales bacterium]